MHVSMSMYTCTCICMCLCICICTCICVWHPMRGPVTAFLGAAAALHLRLLRRIVHQDHDLGWGVTIGALKKGLMKD